MSDTVFICACLTLAVLIVIGLIVVIVTIRRLRKTQKEVQKHEKTKVLEKKYDWYRH